MLIGRNPYSFTYILVARVNKQSTNLFIVIIVVAADGFADRQLQKLEEKIPIVKESSDKVSYVAVLTMHTRRWYI